MDPIAQCVGHSSRNHIFGNVSRYLIGIRHFRVKAPFEAMHQERITTHQFGNIDRPLKMRLSFEPIDSYDDRPLHAGNDPLSVTSDDVTIVAMFVTKTRVGCHSPGAQHQILYAGPHSQFDAHSELLAALGGTVLR